MLTSRISVESWLNSHKYNPDCDGLIHTLFSESLSVNDVYNYQTKSSRLQFVKYLNCIANCVITNRASDGQLLSTMSCMSDMCKNIMKDLPIDTAALGQHIMELGVNVVWDDSFQSEDYNRVIESTPSLEDLQSNFDGLVVLPTVEQFASAVNVPDEDVTVDNADVETADSSDNAQSITDESTAGKLDISSDKESESVPDTSYVSTNDELLHHSLKDTTSYDCIQATYGRLSNLKYDVVEGFRSDYKSCTIDGFGRHRVNFDKVWHSGTCDGETFVIGTSLPEIPELQSDISITTNVDRMTTADLIHLYPTRELKEFRHYMTDRFEGCPYDKYVSSYVPIPGYTQEQLIQNIIKYPFPHEYRRFINDQFVEVWKQVEIDGELVDIVKAFDQSKLYGKVQRCRRVLQEYGYRKAMLDLEYGKAVNYPLIGNIQPYLALVFPEYVYKELGYDTVDLARKSVISRVSLLRSVNPVIRRIGLPCKNV